MAENRELLPIKEIQERLELSRTTLWRLMREGRFHVYSNPRDRRQKLLDLGEVRRALEPELLEGKVAA